MPGKKRHDTNKVSGLLVTVGLLKALDTVENFAAIKTHKKCEAGTLIVNAAKGFLKPLAAAI